VPIPPDAVWISAKQVCQRYGGRSHMWLDRKLRNNPDFPRPVYDGRIRIFRVAELDDYDRALIAARTNNNHTG
jgi:predicted DNA-binding transcriptional regulator AlpA